MPLEVPNNPKIYTTSYSDFKGVDFTNDPSEVYRRRSPSGLNMKPDESGRPWKRTGWEIAISKQDFLAAYPYALDINIKNIYSFELAGQDHMIIFCEEAVFAYTGGQLTKLLNLTGATSEPYRGFFFESNGKAGFYFFAERELRCYKYDIDDDEFVCGVEEPYVPKTIISRSPNGGGVVYEGVNMLTRRRKELFLGDDTSTTFLFSTQAVNDGTFTVYVKDPNGDFVEVHDYTVDYTESTVTFNEAKPPVVAGADNVMIEYNATTYSDSTDAFFDCKTVAIFGTGLINAVFVSGCDNSNYSSRVWYSKTGNPAYFPDLNYFEAGSNDTKVMGLIKVGEYLGVVKQGNQIDSSIYLAYPVNFDEDSTYAVKQAVQGIGAVSKRCFANLEDESLFLSQEGVMAIEPKVDTNERQVKNRSFYINKRLLDEPDLDNAIAYVWDGFYILNINSHCYVLDSTQKSSWATERTNLQYECYYWDNIPATCFGHYNDFLYFGDNNGNLCRFKVDGVDEQPYNDNGEPIISEWSTIFDNDGATNYFKNMQKKGCLVTFLPMDASGAKVYIKVDNKEPKLIGEVSKDSMQTPAEFYINKKFKKYKRLQIIVRNEKLNEGFGIDEIIKMYTIGNYSKNKRNS